MDHLTALSWFGPWPVLLDCAVVYSCVRLSCTDRVTAGLRARLDGVYGDHHLSVLWSCPRCAAFWWALAVVYLHTLVTALAHDTGHRVWMLCAAPLFVWTVASIALERDPT